ncbi:MAG: hypothetical protein ACFE85_12640 [Candidatus Hodarchaeota archaeon]
MHVNVTIMCPICKVKKVINIPNSIISQVRQLTTISIPKDMICKHHFQVFIDKNFNVRGYQKVDFELSKNKYSNIKNLINSDSIKPDMTLKDIYNEFWEYIDDNNKTFREFILKDKKRRNFLLNNSNKVPKNNILLENIQKN